MECACSQERPSEIKINALIDYCSSWEWAISSREKLQLCFKRSAVMVFKRKIEVVFLNLRQMLYVKRLLWWSPFVLTGVCSPRWVKTERKNKLLPFTDSFMWLNCTYFEETIEISAPWLHLHSDYTPFPAREVSISLSQKKKNGKMLETYFFFPSFPKG